MQKLSSVYPDGPSLRLGATRPAAGFRMDDYWVWCGSPVRDDYGRYHLFVSRWSRKVPFSPYWVTHSEVVRAESATPEGPFEFGEVVLPARGEGFWDGRMTHNPSVVRWKDDYLLFYTGTHYVGPSPYPRDHEVQPDLGSKKIGISGSLAPAFLEAHRNQRVGVAIASSPYGPWTRLDHPILEPRPDQWDALITTNPAPWVTYDNKILLIYKSLTAPGEMMRLGIASANRPEGPYERMRSEPILDFTASGQHMEDPFLWQDKVGFHLLVKDMNGGLGGVRGGGVQFDSPDGIHWDPESRQSAYSRSIPDPDGFSTKVDFLERPQLLLDDGHPTHFYAAAAMGGPDHSGIRDSWNTVLSIGK